MRPLRMIEMRSPRRSASSRSWLTNRIVFFTRACSGEQLVLQLVADQRVEGRERLVHQQDVGVGRERAGEPDALLHAARQLADVRSPPSPRGRPARAARRRCAARSAGDSPRSSSPSPTFSATVRQGSRPNCWNTIATRRRRRRRRSSALQRADVDRPVRVRDQHLPARHGIEAVGGAQERRLAGAGQAHHHADLARRDREARARDADDHAAVRGDLVARPAGIELRERRGERARALAAALAREQDVDVLELDRGAHSVRPAAAGPADAVEDDREQHDGDAGLEADVDLHAVERAHDRHAEPAGADQGRDHDHRQATA